MMERCGYFRWQKGSENLVSTPVFEAVCGVGCMGVCPVDVTCPIRAKVLSSRRRV